MIFVWNEEKNLKRAGLFLSVLLLLSFTPPESAGEAVQTTFAEFTSETDTSFNEKTGQFQAVWSHISHPTNNDLIYKTESDAVAWSPIGCAPLCIRDENGEAAAYFFTDEPDKYLFLVDLPAGTPITVTAYRQINSYNGYFVRNNMIVNIQVAEAPQEAKTLNTDYESVIEIFSQDENSQKYLNTEINFDARYWHTGAQPLKKGRFSLFQPLEDEMLPTYMEFPVTEEIEKLLETKGKKAKVRLTVTVEKIMTRSFAFLSYANAINKHLVSAEHLTNHPIYTWHRYECKYRPKLTAVDGVVQDTEAGRLTATIF